MEKKLSECLALCKDSFSYTFELNGDKDPLIKNIVFDSKKVLQGSLFFALPGLHVHGNDFAGQAIDAGASAVIFEGSLPESAVKAAEQRGTVLIRVDNSRFAMSPFSAAFYDYSGQKLCIAGVTGTEGKSSTVFFIWQLLHLAGKKAGFISTVQYSLGDDAVDNPEHQTTPEAPIVQEQLYRMVENGCEFAVVESSSHGLSIKTNRLGDVPFDTAAMMNVNHEHLEFHGTYECYKNDKANLFRKMTGHDHVKHIAGTPKTFKPLGIVNAADPAAEDFVKAAAPLCDSASVSPVCSVPVAGFVPPKELQNSADFSSGGTFNVRDGASGAHGAALNAVNESLYAAGLYRIENVTEPEQGLSFDLCKKGSADIHVTAPLSGAFNACNVTAAILLVAQMTEKDVQEIAALARHLNPVRGRMSPIHKGQPFEVLVDYAHTPSSFYTVFPPLRQKTKGRIISLFGSGGERDTQKRPVQGKIASEYSDIVILTDEDPRGEEPMELLEMIAAGCTSLKRNETLFLIPDRKAAIRKAFSLARPGDAVLLLGKSHENSIIYKDRVMPYDEIKEAETALAEMGYTGE
ncbi:MAG: Mur ligase family protein [Treponema sp.]|uniref:Mur ligase family protein n=1 Tax=Treponema sp. TaxID=166 RepID=UPI003FA1AAF3